MARNPGDSDFTNVNVASYVLVGGTAILGAQQDAIANNAPATAVNQILVALRNHGIIAT